MSATWARLRLGRVYHRALSLALSTASAAPSEGPPAPEGHLANKAPLTRTANVRTSRVDLHPSERLVPAHGTHAESWAYRGGHFPESALASADAPHEEPGCALLAGLPASRGRASGVESQSNKKTEETQEHLTSGDEALESNIKVKLLPAKIRAVDSKVSDAKIEPKTADVKVPAHKAAEGTREESLILRDPRPDGWSYVEANEHVALPLFQTQSDGHELGSGPETSTHLVDRENDQLNNTEQVVIVQFSNETLGSGSSRLSSKDSDFHGTHTDLLSEKSTLEASEPAMQILENIDTRLKDHVVLSIANSSQSFASKSSASASFTPICELIVESDSDLTISTPSSTRHELNSASTNPSDGIDSKADDDEPPDSKAAVVTSAGSCSEPTFRPPPPPPPMPPL